MTGCRRKYRRTASQAALLIALGAVLGGCGEADPAGAQPPPAAAATVAGADAVEASAGDAQTGGDEFRYEAERFADLRILRYRVPGFDELDLEQKRLLYYLYQAGLSGREIIYDQKYRYNLAIRRTLEEIVRGYPGDRNAADFRALTTYLKRIWFSNGIHHHYAHDKFDPGFGFESLQRFVEATPGNYPVREGQSVDELLQELRPIIFDPDVDAKLVNTRAGVDLVAASAVNFYAPGIEQQEVEAFYEARKEPDDPTPVSYGLNSRLEKRDGRLVEDVWKVGGLYTEAIERIVYWLGEAVKVAENEIQREALEKLIAYYESGSLEDWDEYNVAWVEDTESVVDTINGFIEVYNDPIGLRGSYEAVVSFRDPVATRRIDAIAREAQWFEDQSPIMDEHKKENVTGIVGKVITVVGEAGDASPATPIGINLPNSDWIRRTHGSKSVSLGNIVAAGNAVPSESEREFAWDETLYRRIEEYGDLVSTLQVDMHEVIGHASGRLNPGVAPLHETLKNYGSTIEEARADLVALYYIVDPKLVELGLLPSVEAGRVAYDQYVTNGLLQQLRRIEPGNVIEEAHMRNRQMIAAWAYEQGREQGVIERRERDGKTFFVVRDHDALREIFGRLLRELQRIKSEGDFEAARELVEGYGVEVDPELHAEVRERYAALDVPPYSGFINPRLVAVEQGGEIVDVRVEYPEDFSEQMLEYADRYSFLPTWNH
ncbi:MAG: dihydrofolate reductase [Gammaproteobacteria bacterium]|nr:dihydrofolate reductase [Gammaproteobacteria bacterium]